MLSKTKKNLSLPVTWYFSSLHSPVTISHCMFLPFSIQRLTYVNWSCKLASACNWSVCISPIACCILLTWQIFFLPLTRSSTNKYLNKSKTSSMYILFSCQNGIDKGIIPCWAFSLFLTPFFPLLKKLLNICFPCFPKQVFEKHQFVLQALGSLLILSA